MATPTACPTPRAIVLVGLLAGWLALGCGGDERRPTDRIQRLLEAPPVNELFRAGAPRPPRTVLAAADLSPDDWWPVLATRDGPPDDETRAAFAGHSLVRPDGTVVLGHGGGGWLTVFPVKGDAEVELSARVTTRGLVFGEQPVGAVPGVRVGLVQFRRRPTRDDLDDITALVRRSHWTSPVAGTRADAPVSRYVRLPPKARWVGVMVTQPQAVPEGGAAEVADLQLVDLGTAGHARRMGNDVQAGALAPLLTGRFPVRQEHREGVVVPPGAAFAVRPQTPRGPARVQARLGLLADEALDDVTVTVSLGVVAPDGASLARWSRELTSAPVTEARWVVLDEPWPARAPPGSTFVCEVEGPPGSLCLPVVATPRLVPEGPRRVGPNVLFLSLDTLRADRLGCYGYGRDTSPRLDALAARSWLFEDMWAQGPYTLPSHMSMFSGQFPSVHGVEGDADRPDPSRTPLLAQLLREAGWTTAAFTAGGYLHPDFGFGRGFERYSTLEPLANLQSTRVQGMVERFGGLDLEMLAESDMGAVEHWIESHRDESFFLFVHTYAPHQFDPPAEHLAALGLDVPVRVEDDDIQPYLADFATPPDEVLTRISDLYDGSVRQTDAAVGRLLDALARLDLERDTLVVVTSDHGKELGERGLVAHGHSLHRELVEVPLILHVPGSEARREEQPTMSVDILPTLLEHLGLPVPAGIQGRSVTVAGRERPLWAEVDALTTKQALRVAGIKTIHTPETRRGLDADTPLVQSYDTAADRDERRPLPEDPRRLEALHDFHGSLRALGASLGTGSEDTPLSDDVRAHLEELGYTGVDG